MTLIRPNAEDTCLNNRRPIKGQSTPSVPSLQDPRDSGALEKAESFFSKDTTATNLDLGLQTPDPAARIPSTATTLNFPEGGVQGWLVVFGSFCAMVSVFGLINSSAVFESYFSTNQLSQHSDSEIGWIFSLYLFIVFFVGIQVGPIFDHYGGRMLIATGSIILTYSVLGGLGGALLNAPAYGAIAHFFNVRRGLATGIATTSGGIGGIVFPLILQQMLPNLGFAWSCRILALIMLGLAIPANLFIKTRLPPARDADGNVKVTSVWPDLAIFNDSRFAFASLGIFFMEWGLFVPLTFIISYAAEHGQDVTSSYVLLSYLNAGSVVGRVLPGFLADKFGRFNLVIVTIALCVVTLLALWLPAGRSQPLLIAYSVTFGFASGSNLGLVPVCLGQLCDSRQYGRYFSTAMMVASFGTLSSVPIGGALLGVGTGETGWMAVILFAGVSYAIALTCYTTARVLAAFCWLNSCLHTTRAYFHATDKMGELSAPSAFSTPAEHLFEYVEPKLPAEELEAQAQTKSDDELRHVYEITRTAREIQNGGWRRIGLQFPDTMLRDAPRAVQALSAELASLQATATNDGEKGNDASQENPKAPQRIYILADTSYSSCCVDEIAAEHASAEVVVHYGRSCLSPTSRLPVIYVFTQHKFDRDVALNAFAQEYPDKKTPVILMADVTYQDHVSALAVELCSRGYTDLLSTEIIHDPLGQLPNRKIVLPSGALLPSLDLKTYSIFHISIPPTALLLALSSRVASLHIHPTSSASPEYSPQVTPRLLGRRYARCLTLASAGIIGILVNTLSVSNYLASIESLRKQIAAAGKKSYTVVVGKLNPAKLANFAEIDGWVVVGCWESALVEDDAGFYRPVITPFELAVALQTDEERVWTGEWWGGIERVKPLEEKQEGVQGVEKGEVTGGREVGGEEEEDDPAAEEDSDGEEESAPPEFDLRTGRLISHSRPMRAPAARAPEKNTSAGDSASASTTSGALALRSKGELAMVNGVVSPGAEFLRSQRTWQGLGGDYTAEDSAAIEEGRSGVARGYTVGEEGARR
ncbi:putative diphthamide synthesis protein-domain-containing protein [Lasiosphaeris hirsuta]|uniref:S-adenosyl-L-methionine:L-histidine 3-amino-3-carboxypropyltransferase 2 n=1 Tax=Lasiosphaeris hirsuta TaxID=260670 RepID=A0AA40B049_9PEZI|nr:putative diphthamide synthesis protein-domain-containing protein [Lasiosphaeris hirsuta]